jgi:hypothetical protein
MPGVNVCLEAEQGAGLVEPQLVAVAEALGRPLDVGYPVPVVRLSIGRPAASRRSRKSSAWSTNHWS